MLPTPMRRPSTGTPKAVWDSAMIGLTHRDAPSVRSLAGVIRFFLGWSCGARARAAGSRIAAVTALNPRIQRSPTHHAPEISCGDAVSSRAIAPAADATVATSRYTTGRRCARRVQAVPTSAPAIAPSTMTAAKVRIRTAIGRVGWSRRGPTRSAQANIDVLTANTAASTASSRGRWTGQVIAVTAAARKSR